MKMSYKLLSALSVAVMVFACQSADVSASNGIKPVDLRVGPLLDNPISFGDKIPQFSWQLPTGVGVKSQSAYRIVCANQLKDLPDSPDLWDSGWVQSGQSLFVDYAGKPLSSRERVYWSVRFKDQTGRSSAWSKPAFFEMGLLNREDWSAKWIFRKRPESKPAKLEIVKAIFGTTDNDPSQSRDVTEAIQKKVRNNSIRMSVKKELARDLDSKTAKHLRVDYILNGKPGSVTVKEGSSLLIPGRRGSSPSPYLRRGFSVDKPIEKARLYVTAHGLVEMYINGGRVGQDYFVPGWTEYKKRMDVYTYDVTGALRRGENAIGAILGVGWYPWSMGFRVHDNPDGDIQELLCQLHITYTDGSQQIVASDKAWKVSMGPILSSKIYDGERYDARKELGDWAKPGYNDNGWDPVETRSIDKGVALVPLPNRPVRKDGELAPRSVNEPAPGRFVFDLGQNIVGWAKISVPGSPGRKLTLRFAEMLNDDGTIYTKNLRGAKATDEYICKTNKIETWEPRFTFHGFRYIEISGFPKGVRPEKSWVKGVVLHTALPPSGSFASSNKKLNQLQSNIRWGQKGNFLAVPTDCPQRDERLGWTGDAQVFAPTASYNFNTLAFYSKWCTDIRDAQMSNGGIPNVVPNVLGQGVSTGWGDVAVIIPWEVYKSFGYRRILEDNYETIGRWIDFYRNSKDTQNLIYDGFAYGDWLQPYSHQKHGNHGDTPKNLIGTAYFAHSADLASRIATILGKPRDAEKFRTVYQSVSEAFTEKFFDGSGRLTTDIETQTGYLLALAFDLLPEPQRQPAFNNLVRLITKEAGGNLRTGFLGTPLINPTLTRFGRLDLAYGVLFNDRYPGWFFSIDQGATTMWERWNSYTKADGFADAGMNSFNHYAYGAIGDWIYETIGGLSSAKPGYKHILIAPRPGDDLGQASAKLETPYGKAESSWTRTGGRLYMDITIPPNTTATVRVPAGKITDVTENGRPAKDAEDIDFRRMEKNSAVFSVGPGTFHFTSKDPRM